MKVENEYVLKEASEEKELKDLNRKLQNMEKLTADLKELQTKVMHVETLESAVIRVKYKILNNFRLSHHKLKVQMTVILSDPMLML